MILKSKIISNDMLSPDILKMTIESKDIVNESLPGQFVHVKCTNDLSILLRRPISISSINSNNNTFDIIYKLIGKGTKELSKKKENEIIDYLGPLGSSFNIDSSYKKIIVVGGGIGVFPLLFLLQQSPSIQKYAYLGFRNKDGMLLLDEFSSVSNINVSTEDGSYGYKGYVTDLLLSDIEKIEPDIIYTCGPSIMMEKVNKISNMYNIPCQVSVEERMACGIGACLGCMIKINNEKEGLVTKKVCTDGPVFWGNEVYYDNKTLIKK